MPITRQTINGPTPGPGNLQQLLILGRCVSGIRGLFNNLVGGGRPGAGGSGRPNNFLAGLSRLIPGRRPGGGRPGAGAGLLG